MNFQNQIEYGNLNGIDVLSGVPAIPPLNKDTLKSHIMFRCGLLIPLYSEPETMQAAIAHWFNYMAYDISKMIELAETEYLPLENFRRNESETRDQWVTNDKTNTGTDTMSHTGTIDDSGGETITDTGTITDEFSNNNEHSVSAYNDSDYSPDNKDEGGGENERTLDTEREVTNGNTRTFLNDDTRTLDLSDNSVQHNADTVTRLEYGNIGVMTTQDMFNQELDLLDRFNPYNWIVDRMESDLFLGIW